MANLSRKLQPLKVTFRPTRGKVQTKLVYRDDSSSTRSLPVATAGTSAQGEPYVDDDDRVECSSQMPDEAFSEGPSLHTIQKQANAAAWERIRHQLLRVLVESEAMPRDQLCVKCSIVAASLRCRKCHPSAFFCKECFLSTHTTTNIFHVPEEWKVSVEF